jgi:hypothetical protein
MAEAQESTLRLALDDKIRLLMKLTSIRIRARGSVEARYKVIGVVLACRDAAFEVTELTGSYQRLLKERKRFGILTRMYNKACPDHRRFDLLYIRPIEFVSHG